MKLSDVIQAGKNLGGKYFAMNSVCHLDAWIINFINEHKICESGENLHVCARV